MKVDGYELRLRDQHSVNVKLQSPQGSALKVGGLVLARVSVSKTQVMVQTQPATMLESSFGKLEQTS